MDQRGNRHVRDAGDTGFWYRGDQSDVRGCCSCATCHMYVDDQYASAFEAISPAEDGLLDTSDRRKPQSRLSCQLRVSDAASNALITVAPEG